jgi:flagellar biosynthesis protein FlhA
MVSIAVFQKVLQLLLDESVHIRDIRTIIESWPSTRPTPPTRRAGTRVRIALSPAIVQQIYGPTRELNVIAIDPAWSACWCRPWAMPPARRWTPAWPTS